MAQAVSDDYLSAPRREPETFRVISYDIPDDRRRGRLATLLEGYGRRVQYSVFECILTDTQLQELETRMRALLHLGEDSVRVYSLPPHAARQIRVLGVGAVTKKEIVLIPPDHRAGAGRSRG